MSRFETKALKVNGSETKKRNISAHNLPISLGGPRPRPEMSRPGPASAFLAQLLATRENAPLARARGQERETLATRTYRTVEASDIKRMPVGYRKTLSA
jgi:hypothetical protein